MSFTKFHFTELLKKLQIQTDENQFDDDVANLSLDLQDLSIEVPAKSPWWKRYEAVSTDEDPWNLSLDSCPELQPESFLNSTPLLFTTNHSIVKETPLQVAENLVNRFLDSDTILVNETKDTVMEDYDSDEESRMLYLSDSSLTKTKTMSLTEEKSDDAIVDSLSYDQEFVSNNDLTTDILEESLIANDKMEAIDKNELNHESKSVSNNDENDYTVHEESIVLYKTPNELKLDLRLINAFVKTAEIPLKRGNLVETLGILVGTQIGKELRLTHLIIPKQFQTFSFCEDSDNTNEWILNEFKPWGKKTKILGTIHSHIYGTENGLSSIDLHSQAIYQKHFGPLSVSIVAAFNKNHECISVEAYKLTSEGNKITKKCKSSEPHPSCSFNKSYYESAPHIKIDLTRNCDWEVHVIDKRRVDTEELDITNDIHDEVDVTNDEHEEPNDEHEEPNASTDMFKSYENIQIQDEIVPCENASVSLPKDDINDQYSSLNTNSESRHKNSYPHETFHNNYNPPEEINIPNASVTSDEIIDQCPIGDTETLQKRQTSNSNQIPNNYKEETVAQNGGKWTKSSKGGDMYCVNGVAYHVREVRKSAKTNELTVYLRCSKKTKYKCLGVNRIVSGKLIYLEHEGHLCPPDPLIGELLEAENNIRERAAKEINIRPAKLVDEELMKMHQESKIYLKSTRNLKQTILRERRKNKGKMAKTIQDMDVPRILLPGNVPFVLFDSKDEEPDSRLIILGTSNGLKWLGQSEEWDGDGTFDCTPTSLTERFSQFYSHHGCIKNDKFPMIFSLMQKKDVESYKRLLKVLKFKMSELGTKSKPFVIKVNHGGVMNSDMEKAVQIAEKEEFPGAKKQNCLFHLRQRTQKVVGDCELKCYTFSNEEFNEDIRMLDACCFLPPDIVKPVFNELKNDFVKRNSKALPILENVDKYLVNGYINKRGEQVDPAWYPSEWSVYERVMRRRTRTTDKIEAWHRRLQALFSRPHQNLETFLITIAEEWNFIENNISKLLYGVPREEIFEPKSKSEREREERIVRVVTTMADYEDSLDYLRNVARAMRFK